MINSSEYDDTTPLWWWGFLASAPSIPPAKVQRVRNEAKQEKGKYLRLKTFENKSQLDLQSAGSSPNLTYTKSALDAIRIL